MSKALPGTHLCADHQGNHSHYDKENCEMCRAIERAEYWKEYCHSLADIVVENERLEKERLEKENAALRKKIADATSKEGVERAWKAYCTNGSYSPSVSTLAALRAALGEEVKS